ncbi:MAG: alpha-1,2-fucosyltransferase [Selenomonadaceae bacterium]|nr:alpha-1,2-fucosyltransferase [Selenomonadaceae bacterium]
MIITTLYGGLGNQLFQYAAGRYLAWKHKTKLKLDLTQCNLNTNSHHAFYNLGAFNIQENFATESEIGNLPVVNNKNPWIFEPHILNLSNNICLKGFWQSEKYFVGIEDILRKEFTLKNPLGKNSAAWKEEILASKCSVSVHIRHGDFITYYARNTIGLLPLHHYDVCIKQLQEKYSDLTVYVFSDDLQWCKENFKVDAPTKFVEGCEHDFEELYLMSLCHHNILSRGTFSWWSAWLNKNPDKKIFAPYPWQLCINYESDIIPDSWIKIPADYSSWMPPMLSIIVYIENDLPTINLLLQSVLMQNFRDYEIILVDASVDYSRKFCHQAALDERVTTLKVDSSTNKFTAWNKGLDVARGDYVTFMTAKNFLFPYSVAIFSGICEQIFKQYSNTRENYITYKNYDYYLPNIVCATQMIEEDERGEINVNGIPNKKFSPKIDPAFQNLNGITEVEIPNQQKLLAIGSNGINGLVGTKFFKHKFLNENKIRFNENEGVDAELKFIVDAFMSTEKITFASALFYGRLK